MTTPPPPVLLLHGLGGCALDWEHVVPYLGGAVAVPDAPAHGGRACPPDLGFEAMAEAALREADTVGFDQFVVAGISMGAATAATLAATSPERVLGVLYVAPAWLDAPEPPNLRRLQKLGHLLRRHGRGPAWSVVETLPPVVGWDQPDVLALRERFMAHDVDATARALIELPGRLPIWPAPAIVPARVMTWRNDPIHPVEVADAVGAIVAGPVEVMDRPKKRAGEALVLAAAVDALVRAAAPVRPRT